MLDAAERGERVLVSQRYLVNRSVAEGDQVALEVEWTRERGLLRFRAPATGQGTSWMAPVKPRLTLDPGPA